MYLNSPHTNQIQSHLAVPANNRVCIYVETYLLFSIQLNVLFKTMRNLKHKQHIKCSFRYQRYTIPIVNMYNDGVSAHCLPIKMRTYSNNNFPKCAD